MEVLKKNAIEGYKVFKSDWKCRNFQCEVGKTYHHKGKIEPCEQGFHFCTKMLDCFNYYEFDPNNKIALVQAWGTVIEHEDKCVCDKIHILKELSWSEVLELVNIGKGNSGKRNTGDRNTGDWNTGDWNTGYLNTLNGPIYIFNKPLAINRNDIDFPNFFYFDFKPTTWIGEENMTEAEKEANPTYETTRGYLRKNKVNYKAAWRQSWEEASLSDKRKVFDLPNWDAEVFFEISGIDLRGKSKEDIV